MQMAAEELIHLMTIIYVAIQEALDNHKEMTVVREKLRKEKPDRCGWQAG